MGIDQSWKGLYKVSGFCLLAAGALLFVFILCMVVFEVSLPLSVLPVLENPQTPISMFILAATGELLLMPGMLGLYFSLKNVNKNVMLLGAAFWMMAVVMFVVSRGQIISLSSISNSYLTATTETMTSAYMVFAEGVIALSNVFADMALMLLGVASVIIGLVMLKGVFWKKISYLVILAGIFTLLGTLGIVFEPITILTMFGLILSAVWQLIVGIKLFKLG